MPQARPGRFRPECARPFAELRVGLAFRAALDRRFGKVAIGVYRSVDGLQWLDCRQNQRDITAG